MRMIKNELINLHCYLTITKKFGSDEKHIECSKCFNYLF